MALSGLLLTINGYESQLAINNLSHFLLFQLLKPALLSGTTPEFQSLKLIRSPEQGAATTISAAIGKEREGRGGRYLTDRSEAEPGEDDGDDWSSASTSHLYSPEDEARLWNDSLHVVGLSSEEW
ncbi:short-chain dehydrogenase [Paracoccidioides lutzii Pb01]|uniref:Short-chain dehydrogenase n=1 Tax=Paracoccidioides lutzii (strain ATCC MYA-826 / Pb01) TaxID=502779 RepID=C1GS78_PARBA|nr:short-chain dehydrogenase [Paracoccidioides lutzii Pb01]EEH38911.2 short-chain dehydrogenase [Paracoccidioides lutzii Pb01]